MRILVTGANGMVARATAEHCRQIGDTVTALGRDRLDISNRDQVFETVIDSGFNAILNCAAYTDVDGAETNRDACFASNVIGVENLALAAKRSGAAFVTISTDFVFSGENPGFYTQRDTPDPKSVYGRSKLEGEDRARSANAATIIVRSGWIYGPGGTNFLSVMHRLLAEGKRIKAIGDSFGTPTFAGDLARRLRELAELDLPGTFHVTNSGPGMSYLEFAEAVAEFGRYDRQLIEPVSRESLSRPAPRPVSSKLACLFSERLGLSKMPLWSDSLNAFLESQAEAD